MQITGLDGRATEVETEAVVVGVQTEGRLSPPARHVDEATGGVLTRLVETEELTGKPCELVTLHGPRGVAAKKVICVGLGDPEQLNQGIAFQASAAASVELSCKRHQQVAFLLGEDWDEQLTSAGVAGAVVGTQGQDLYRAEKKHYPFGEVLWAGGSAKALEVGHILGDAVNVTRRLVNEPPDRLYPEVFATEAERIASEVGLECEIWDQSRLEAENCGSLLAVARGSVRPPRLVILRHSGVAPGETPAARPPLALVGKGVTFDSGGLSLKPSEGMKTMKCDMAGAATVVGAMQAIARLGLPVGVVGLVGLVENMPSGSAMKLGDVLTARTGKTIEVLNTDAEGRLVLADVLATAVELGVERIIDLATLTGACVVALGTDTAGLMSNDETWLESVRSSAELCGEPAWPLPMFPEFSQQIKSEIADIKNVGEGRWAGAITAAKFLEEFVDGTPWTHIDIAGPAFLEKPKPWCGGGGSGAFVRTLVQVVNKLAEGSTQ